MTEGTMGVSEDVNGVVAAASRTAILGWLSPRGRLPRAAYWRRYVLPILLVQSCALLVDELLAPRGLEVMPASLLGAVALAWPAFAGTVKRMHDLDYSAWILPLLIVGVPTAAAVATLIPSMGPAGLVVAVPALTLALGALWVTVRVAAARGTVGPNRHGPDPLAGDWLDTDSTDWGRQG
jgi:uncharacterized membrane protein YhaH (DUF805 family)